MKILILAIVTVVLYIGGGFLLKYLSNRMTVKLKEQHEALKEKLNESQLSRTS